MCNRLIIFDFDGTISNKDSMLEFTKFYCGNLRFIQGMILLGPTLVLFKLGVIPNWKAKEKYLKYFFFNEPSEKVYAFGDQFCNERLPSFIRPAALALIKEHQKSNEKMVVVTSSADIWLKSWCDQLGLDLIATQLEVVDGKITGLIDGKNCYGREKVERLKSKYDLEKYDRIIAYGDSKGDYDLFEIATEHHYKPFRKNVE